MSTALLRPRLGPGARRQLATLRQAGARLLDAFVDVVRPVCTRWMPTRRLVVVVAPDGSLGLHRVFGETLVDLGPAEALQATEKAALIAQAWSAVELHLPPSRMLTRHLRLPAAGRGFLHQILEHRLERLTPWRPDRIVYGYRVVKEEADTIGIAFVAMQKSVMAEAVTALGALGLTATAAGPASATPAAPLSIDLLGSSSAASQDRLRSGVLRVWSGLMGVLALAAVASFTWASVTQEQQRVIGRDLAKARRSLRIAAEGGGGAEAAIRADKRPEASAVLLLDRLGRELPDDSSLRELQITGTDVRLAGQSHDAPALIAHLERAGLVKVRFSAPVTRETSGLDTFEITAERGEALTGGGQ